MATVREFPTSMVERLKELEEIRTTLLAELEEGSFDPLYAESGRWSISEIAYHLYLVETRITGLLKQLLSLATQDKPANEETLRTEWKLTSSRASDREIRSQAPVGTLPEQSPSLTETLNMLKKSRVELMTIMSNVTIDALARVSAPHPMEVIGVLTGAGWLSLIAHHEMRHTRQIRDIKALTIG